MRLSQNSQDFLIKGTFALILGLAIYRALTAGRREKEKENELVEIATTSTNVKNPFNDEQFIQYAEKNKIIVTRFTDGGAKKADEIFSYFGRLNEDEEKIIQFFRGLSSQYQVAQISRSLRKKYSMSLIDLLKNGIPTFFFSIGGGLSSNDMAKVIKIVDSLPKYLKK